MDGGRFQRRFQSLPWLRRSTDTSVEVGDYHITLSSDGSRLSRSSQAREERRQELAQALEAIRAEMDELDVVTQMEEQIGDLEAATSDVEGAVESATKIINLLQGNIDLRTVAGEADVLLRKATAIYDESRLRDFLRIARLLASILLLLHRWNDLVQVLQRALHAAHLLGDVQAQAWAEQELGTLYVAAGDTETGQRLLEEARGLRQGTGDVAGAQVTTQNLHLAVNGTNPVWSEILPWIAANKVWLGATLAGAAVLGGSVVVTSIVRDADDGELFDVSGSWVFTEIESRVDRVQNPFEVEEGDLLVIEEMDGIFTVTEGPVELEGTTLDPRRVDDGELLALSTKNTRGSCVDSDTGILLAEDIYAGTVRWEFLRTGAPGEDRNRPSSMSFHYLVEYEKDRSDAQNCPQHTSVELNATVRR